MNGTGNMEDISADTVPTGRLSASLVAKRKIFGANTPAGHRCSNLAELLESRKTATGERLKSIERSMARQAADLARLSMEPALKRNIDELSLDRLREVLDYDPKTGALTWRVRLGPMCKFGQTAGVIKGGYRRIAIDGRSYTASHLAWFHFYGIPPIGLVDHKNGDKTDQSIENLRPATHSQNSMNQGRNKNNTTGFKGVAVFNKPGEPTRFRASIRANRKRIFLGIFDTPEEAYEVYCNAAKEHHGEFARVK